MHYIPFYTFTENVIEKRALYREAHLKWAKNYFDRGDLIITGGVDQPLDSAVLIFKGESPQIAEDFAKNDPYVLHGVVVQWQVRPYIVGFIKL
jgi:uncharacterized protein YciI